jgi:hypothetical protein
VDPTTGLTRRELAGAHLIVTANVAATQDTDVDPHDWRLLTLADDRPAARTVALSAA